MKGGDRHKPQSPSIGSKSAVAIVPPKKVIRANDDYHPDEALVQSFAKAGVQVLSFSKGDFFHVIGREDDPRWYEACNPALPDARGLVPVAYFQVLGRTERDSAQSDGGRLPPAKSQDHDSGYGETALQPPPAPAQRSSKPTKTSGTVYAKVCHTFEADPSRPDELSAQEGENLIIIAQSNHEWVVAKPIMRLGGPGLIPLSFIDLFDEVHLGVDAAHAPVPVGDALKALKKASVPSVEEWKRMAAQYKNSSITLGKFDGVRNPAGPQKPGVEQGMARMSLQQAGARHSNQSASQHQGGYQGHPLPVPRDSYAVNSVSESGTPVWARIPRYCFAEEKYWFVIEAEFPDGRYWELARYYQDFYDFQIALLAEFPVEAGNAGNKKRTLPYMPGPVSYVTDAITEGRLYNLDAYIKNLLNQPEHISQCHLVKLLFTPRDGDYEIDANEMGVDEYRLSGGSRQSSVESPANAASRRSSPNESNGYGYSGLSATPRQGSNSHQGAAAQTQQQQNQPPASAMKIKVRFKDDVFAMQVATDIQFQELQDKIRDRVRAVPNEQVQLFYQDEPSGSMQNMMSEKDLYVALQRNEKLMVCVEV